MSSIWILPEDIVNKIAAGEVIERPASVVRELIDNSIDADATRIDVEILQGGRGLIKVSDNGHGMDRDDAILCIERHATSKIKDIKDLFNISTLGFRGEALSAISSVSKIRIMTSTPQSLTGIMVEASGGRNKRVSEIPPVSGTIVEVRDLFFNTPARRKFLKSITTETSHIIETVLQKALAYPNISFTLINNRSEILNAPAVDNIRERFIQVYGKDMIERFVYVEKRSDTVTLFGFVSKTEYQRSGRGHQYLFINHRPVKNPTVAHAIYSVYRDVLADDRHPSYFLFIEIDPSMVDFNVHPAKKEVKFRDPERIHTLIRNAIKDTIITKKTIPAPLPPRPQDYTEPVENKDIPSVSEPLFGISSLRNEKGYVSKDILTKRGFHIGEAFYGVIMDDGLMIIDHHAAHERVMYEKFLKKDLIHPEPLLIPLRIEMPPPEYEIILNSRGLLREFGIEVDDFGRNNIIVRAIPKELHGADMKGILIDIAQAVREGETEGIDKNRDAESLRKGIASKLACHRSVRGRDELNDEELTRLINDLENTEQPDKCPHGRPTRILLSIDDLRKMFKDNKWKRGS